MKVDVGPLERRSAAGQVRLGCLIVGEEDVVVALADGTALVQRLAPREVPLRLLEVGTRRLLGRRRGARIRLRRSPGRSGRACRPFRHIGTFDEVPLEDRALHQRAHLDPVRRLRFGGELEHRRHMLRSRRSACPLSGEEAQVDRPCPCTRGVTAERATRMLAPSLDGRATVTTGLEWKVEGPTTKIPSGSHAV